MPRKRFVPNKHCPYQGCPLYCRNRQNHRARYATITVRWRKKVSQLDDLVQHHPNQELTYNTLKDIGILWPLNLQKPDHPSIPTSNENEGNHENEGKI